MLPDFIYKFTLRLSQEEFSKVSVVKAHEEAVTFFCITGWKNGFGLIVLHYNYSLVLVNLPQPGTCIVQETYNSIILESLVSQNEQEFCIHLLEFCIVFLLNHIRKYKDHLSYTTDHNKIYYELPKNTEV